MDLLTEYYTSLIEHVKASSDVEGRLIEFEFLNYILNLLSDAGEFDDYTIIEDGRDGAGRWQVDGYSYDENNLSLSLFVTLLSSDDTPAQFTKRDITPLLKKLGKFLKTSVTSSHLPNTFEPSSNCYQAAVLIQENWENIKSIKFILLSNRPAADRMKLIALQDINKRPCAVQIWDLQRIYKLESSRNEREEMVIDLRDDPLPCLVTNGFPGGEQSILAVMPGSRLVSLYGKWGPRLLEQNVRSFLQHRGKINKGIRLTILNEPKRFFAYNNGLTTTAQAVTIENTLNGPAITELKNLQIVNGGQTTAAIFSAHAKDKIDLSDVSVQMKLTVISDEVSSELVSKISKYANSQNKVSDADLFSNHPFHVRLEEFSRRIWVPAKSDQNTQTHWYYERARGQYLDSQAYMTPSKRKQFQQINPRAQLLTKTDIAKIMNSWDCLPYEVSKGAQKNFAKFAEQVDTLWGKDDLAFNESYFRSLVYRAWIFRALEKAVMKESWYSGYRANIITYSIARLSEEVNKSPKIWNIDLLWRTKTIPSKILENLLALGKSISELLLAEDRPVGNPSEYAKRPMFWERVRVLKCDISNIDSLLISKSEEQRQLANSKETQKTDDGIHIQTKILNTDKSTWEKIESFLIEDDSATPSLMGLLQVAKHPSKVPSEKQSVILYKLLYKYSDRVPVTEVIG